MEETPLKANQNLSKNRSADNAVILEAVLNTVLDGIITINNLGIIQSFNLSAERIFGYSLEEVIGKNVKMLMPAPYHGEHDHYLKNYHDTGDKKIIGIGRKVSARRKDGSIFSMELGVNEMEISGEKMFVGTIRDVSDREQAQQEMRDSEAKMRAILDNTVDGMITIDENGRIETFNRACTIIFGYKPEEVLGQNVKMLMPDPYYSEHDDYLKKYNSTGVNQIIGVGREVEGKRKDGTIFPLDLSVSEVRVKDRTIYSGIVRDITERKHAEEKLRQANAELEEFAYRTSHDLRSPLVSSIGLLKYAEESIKNKKNSRAIDMLELAQKSLRGLEHLIKNILSLTKMKNLEEEDKYLSVAEVIDSVLERLSQLNDFERLDVQVQSTFKEKILTKESRFVLILENLTSNAIKYQDKNKEKSFMRIQTYSLENNFILTVEDNGLGIPKENQDKLFMMFKRFHPKISFGSGLGLYMIKKSTDVIGGKISFTDTGDGSMFCLSIPIEKNDNSLIEN